MIYYLNSFIDLVQNSYDSRLSQSVPRSGKVSIFTDMEDCMKVPSLAVVAPACLAHNIVGLAIYLLAARP